MDPTVPEIHTSKKISRRDFLKLASAGIATAVATPLITDSERLAQQTLLETTRQLLIKNEDIPDGVYNTPDRNEKFDFADETLKQSINIYREWAQKFSLPHAHYQKPSNYISLTNLSLTSQVDTELETAAKDTVSTMITKNGINTPNLDKLKGLDQKLIDTCERNDLKPMRFSEMYSHSVTELLENDPGSPILNRVKKKASKNSSEEDLIQLLHSQIDPIWEWVDDQVKQGINITPAIFLAKLIYENQGDIQGALWDATLLTKLAARNNHQTFKFNDLKATNPPPNLSIIRQENALFLHRVMDTFAPRISANWVSENADNPLLFAHRSEKYKPKNFKPFDAYSAAGNIYHIFNIMALSGVMDKTIIISAVALQHTDQENGKFQLKSEFGLEKIAADWLACSRISEMQNILTQLPPPNFN